MMVGRGCFRPLRDGKHDAAEPLVKGPTAPMSDLAKPDPNGKAQDAFAAYAALQMAQRADPALSENPNFRALLDSAYARFLILFGKPF